MKNFNVTSMLVMLMFMCITSMQAQSITPSKKYITKELLIRWIPIAVFRRIETQT